MDGNKVITMNCSFTGPNGSIHNPTLAYCRSMVQVGDYNQSGKCSHTNK